MEFFRRTYLTEGLQDLLAAAARRIGGDRNASPVVNLQTNFGGGKTHSMLALWHLLSGTPLTRVPGRGAARLLGGGHRCRPARRVALVGNHIAAGKGDRRKPDGTQVQTLWGELAWQLGFGRGRGGRGARARTRSSRTPTRPGPTRRAALGDADRARTRRA